VIFSPPPAARNHQLSAPSWPITPVPRPFASSVGPTGGACTSVLLLGGPLLPKVEPAPPKVGFCRTRPPGSTSSRPLPGRFRPFHGLSPHQWGLLGALVDTFCPREVHCPQRIVLHLRKWDFRHPQPPGSTSSRPLPGRFRPFGGLSPHQWSLLGASIEAFYPRKVQCFRRLSPHPRKWDFHRPRPPGSTSSRPLPG